MPHGKGTHETHRTHKIVALAAQRVVLPTALPVALRTSRAPNKPEPDEDRLEHHGLEEKTDEQVDKRNNGQRENRVSQDADALEERAAKKHRP
jgi:hypothetical protein